MYVNVVKGLLDLGIKHKSIIVGEGPIRSELEAKLPDTIFTGYMGGDALSRAYASSELFLFPSDTETFGNVTLEAMASGLPTVCADATGSNALVHHGKTGFLAPAGDFRIFLDYTSQLVTDGDLRARMSHTALERAKTYEWETILSHIVTYYDRLRTTSSASQTVDSCSNFPLVLKHAFN